jgi:prophage regulatory protein
VKLYYEKAELPDATTLSASTIEEEIRQERFPKPRQLAGRRVGWLVEEVLEWARTRPVSQQPPPPNTGAAKPRATGGRQPAALASHQGA